MRLTSPSELRRLLAEHGIRPSRVLGQNFLADSNILRIVLDTAGLNPEDRVLEIGPGVGVLTAELVRRTSLVIAVEKDRRLFALLQDFFAGRKNLELVRADALELDLPGLLSRGLNHVVSNLPYSAGTRILVELVHARPRPERLTVTLQSDVAERIVAAPHDSAYGLLAVWIQRLYEADIVRRISRTCFWPPPEVESALVVLRRRAAPVAEVDDLGRFIALTRRVFMHRRKTMQRILRDLEPRYGGIPGGPSDGLLELGIDPFARPQNLAIRDWARLANAMGGGRPP